LGALGVRDDLRTLLRAGRGDVVNETRSLFSIGVVRDVRRIGGTMLAAAALGEREARRSCTSRSSTRSRRMGESGAL